MPEWIRAYRPQAPDDEVELSRSQIPVPAHTVAMDHTGTSTKLAPRADTDGNRTLLRGHQQMLTTAIQRFGK